MANLEHFLDNRKRGHVRFAAFDVDLGTGELRKHGIKILLQTQPFEVLAILLEKPGELVSREELKEKIWGADTYIDFDQGVNKAIKKIRAALGDSAEEPKYIETLARRGYRFIAALSEEAKPPAGTNPDLAVDHVEAPNPLLPKPAETAIVETAPTTQPRRKYRRWMAALVGVVLAAGLVGSFVASRRSHLRDLKPKQLTTNPDENFVANAIISPDGKYLLYGDQVRIRIRLIATGETHAFDKPATLSPGDVWLPTAWFPDQSRFVAVSKTLTQQGQIMTSWIVNALGGGVTELRAGAYAHSVSPDGTLIAFAAGPEGNHEIWVTGPRGEDARKIATSDSLGAFLDVQWSPDGQRLSDLRFQAGGNALARYVIESRDLKGGAPTEIVSLTRDVIGWKNGEGFCWLRDGRIVYTAAESDPENIDTNLWEIEVDPKSGRPLGRPRRLTTWFGFHIDGMNASRDGRRIVLQRRSRNTDVYVGKFDSSGRLQSPRRLTHEQSTSLPLAWMPDSTAVIFTSDRSGPLRLYKQRLDQDIAEPITTGPDVNAMVDVSPDDRWIVYTSYPEGGLDGPGRLMRMPVSGGPPQFVMNVGPFGNIFCPRLPATRCIVMEFTKAGQMVFTSFDPVRGDNRELFRDGPEAGRWSGGSRISPDGSQIATFRKSAGVAWIQILSLAGKVEQEAQIVGCNSPYGLNWGLDGQKMYISCAFASGATLLRVDRSGRTEPLWQMKGTPGSWAIPSPNDRYLAILGNTTSGNAWLLEDF